MFRLRYEITCALLSLITGKVFVRTCHLPSAHELSTKWRFADESRLTTFKDQLKTSITLFAASPTQFKLRTASKFTRTLFTEQQTVSVTPNRLDHSLGKERGYVNETQVLEYLLERDARFYFATDARHFGTSTLVQTLFDFFKGERRRFEDLTTIIGRGNGRRGDWIEYPVIYLDFSAQSTLGKRVETGEEFANNVIDHILKTAKKKHGLMYKKEDFLLSRMAEELKKRFKNRLVVILVNEYDAPVRNALKRRKRQLATDLARYIDEFFEQIVRGCAPHLKLLFVTGLSRQLLDMMHHNVTFVDLSGDGDFISAKGLWGDEVSNDSLESIMKGLKFKSTMSKEE